MKRNMRMAVALALVAPVAAAASGCIAAFLVGAGLGVAGMKYVEGEGKTSFGASLEETRTATRRALEDLSMPILDRGHDAFSAKIGSHTADGKDVFIDLKHESEKITMVSIRVGFWGDETIARAIFAKIEENLKRHR